MRQINEILKHLPSDTYYEECDTIDCVILSPNLALQVWDCDNDGFIVNVRNFQTDVNLVWMPLKDSDGKTIMGDESPKTIAYAIIHNYNILQHLRHN
jgi:hypothetical protein